MSENTSVVPSINMGALLGDPSSNPVPKTPLENALAEVDPEDASATAVEQVKFKFRDLLGEQQLADLKKNAPAAAERMIGDYNSIIQFGAPVLDKLNETSVHMLNVQQEIEIPAADRTVNDLLRTMDGYSAKYHNQQAEDLVDKIRGFFKGVGYSLKTMVRESKPIVEKLDMAAENLRGMEIKLGDNVTRGQELHKQTTKTLEEVVAVLAALEEIVEVSKNEFNVIDNLIIEAEKNQTDEGVIGVTYKGKTVTLNELRTIHATYANGVSEMEKTWFDWRQQFFLGYSQAPTILNLILVSATMQRRCQVFRTMGIPQARRALVLWQQAQLAKEGAEQGEAVADGVNKLIRQAADAAGEAVAVTAKAAQTPVIEEATVFSIINSVKAQCDGLVAADKWGREMRARNLQALEAGEKGIKDTFTESRRQLVANAIQAAQTPQELAPAPDQDILKQIGVGTE